MTETIQLGDITIEVTRKDIKHAHLSVHPPNGRITLVAPKETRLEVARAYAASKLGWIRDQQAKMRGQARETPRSSSSARSLPLGAALSAFCQEEDVKPFVKISHRNITLTVRPGSTREKRDSVMQDWHRSLLHEVVPGLIRTWEAKLGVNVAGYFIQRMKTKWGGCNHRERNIRLNTELVKKPKDLLEYVVVHEMLHLIEPTHSARFTAMLAKYYPSWQAARMELNDLPLGAEQWRE